MISAINLYCIVKEKISRSFSFSKQVDKYCHQFICLLFKQTLSNEQKPVYTLKILISEQIAFRAALYFGQVFVFCTLINKSVFEKFLLMMSN